MNEVQKIFTFIGCLLIFIGGYGVGYNQGKSEGYRTGETDGYWNGTISALDTMQTIVDNQIKSDTTVSKVSFIKPDTFVFVLSPKTIRPK